jgi:hypothetical protein
MRFKTIVVGEAERIFAAIADFGQLSRWDPFVDRSELAGGVAMEPGARYQLRSVAGLTLEYELIDVTAPHRVIYRGGTKRVTSLDTITVSTLGSAVEIWIESDIDFDGWTRLIAPFALAGLWLGGHLRTLPALRRFVRMIV